MSDNKLNLFSLKILIHRVALTKLAFKTEEPVLSKPGFKIKFVDFPHMIIMAKSSMYLEDFQSKDDLLNTKKQEVKIFGKGKSVFLNAKYQDMVDYLENYALIIQFKDFRHQNHQTIGKSLLNMDMFIKDVKYIISDDIERFRRNTFKLTDNDNNCVGWFDMSISVLQRPVSCITKQITKKLGSFDSQDENINIMQRKEDTILQQQQQQQLLQKQDSKQNQQQKANILIVDTFGNEGDVKKGIKDRQKGEFDDDNEGTNKVVVMKPIQSKGEFDDLDDSSVLRISEFQGPSKSVRRKSLTQTSNDPSQKQVKKPGQLQVISKQNSKETYDLDNQRSPNNNLGNSTDEYFDDFEASNVHTSVQQQSTSYQQAFKGKPTTNKQQQQQQYQQSVDGEDYDEDFESMSASQSHQVSKRQAPNNIDKKKQPQQDFSVSKVQEDAISEVYTEDFESMSISQSFAKNKNQLKPVRR